MASGKMPLHKDSRKKTAFKCEFGTFQYRVVPMGSLSSTAHFQRFVETKLERHGVLHRLVHPESKNVNGAYFDPDGNRCVGFACVYIDDIVVFSHSADQHKKHVERLLEVLSMEGLRLNPSKCSFGCKYIQYLGVWVSIYMAADKVRSIIDMPLPN